MGTCGSAQDGITVIISMLCKLQYNTVSDSTCSTAARVTSFRHSFINDQFDHCGCSSACKL